MSYLASAVHKLETKRQVLTIVLAWSVLENKERNIWKSSSKHFPSLFHQMLANVINLNYIDQH